MITILSYALDFLMYGDTEFKAEASVLELLGVLLPLILSAK